MLRTFSITILLLWNTAIFAQNIVVTIKPLHSLVQNILGDTANARLIVDNATSPHDYQLKPSSLKKIISADIVFYIDNSLEIFMRSVLASTNSKTKFIEIAQSEIIKTQLSESHSHEGSGRHGQFNPHIWLNPELAQSIAIQIEIELSRLYPKNKQRYQQNLQQTLNKLTLLDANLAAQLKPIHNISYIVQHDGYHYFEQRYHLTPAGIIAQNPAIPPSVRITEKMTRIIEKQNVECIFIEPQYSDKLASAIAQTSSIQIGILDPIGSDLDPGVDLYFTLLTNLTHNMVNCLAEFP